MNAYLRGRFFVRHFMAIAAAALLAMALAGCAGGQRGVPATGAIANFGQISAELYRGAQPDDSGMAQLQRLGVATLINLRMTGDGWPEEEAAARRHGMAYHQVPLHGFSAPTAGEVAQVLALIESSPGPVFLHCEHGADRTGTIVACYRIRHDRWPTGQALEEAKKYGLSDWEFGMKRFVRKFPAQPAPTGTLVK